ncbi:MAG: methylated-DNA--[protein]-cysteine S-methyltransferase [Pseudomonadota bacterium]
MSRLGDPQQSGQPGNTATASESNRHVAQVDTPIGPIVIVEHGERIERVLWGSEVSAFTPTQTTSLLKDASRQLKDYFAGRLKRFDLPLGLSPDPFRRKVQQAMLAIPYGETCTYGDIASALDTYGQPVGQACGANGIPIIVPCHRVLSANGVGGFSGAGGVETKILLLKHEGGFPYLI